MNTPSLRFQASPSQATSKNIGEYLRIYNAIPKQTICIITDILQYSKIYREAGRRPFFWISGLLVASDIERISENILEYITLLQNRWYTYSQIFFNILWYTAKQVGGPSFEFQASSLQATSKNIGEYIRIYNVTSK